MAGCVVDGWVCGTWLDAVAECFGSIVGVDVIVRGR